MHIIFFKNLTSRRANSDLEQFAYVAAHDLQEPLRNITISAQLVTRRHGADLHEEAARFVNNIVDSAQRMQSLVNDLLLYSRSIGDDQPQRGTLNGDLVLERVLSDISTLVKETQSSVTADPLSDIPISATHLSQLLHNLIGNAIKYRRPGIPPRISISLQRHATEIVLCVADNGLGIPVAHRENVFGLFKRLHGSDVPGTGLGLAICKRIIEHYGGKIWVTNGEGDCGSTFCIALPRESTFTD